MTKGLVRNKVEMKGFGFIIADGKEYFFHSSQCITPYNDLLPGTTVQFNVEHGPKGARAKDVEKI